MKLEKCIRVLADLNQINACRLELKEIEPSLSGFADLLNLAGNEVRLKILYFLDKERELCVCDLSDILGVNISAVSQHLRKMKDGGFVINNKMGQTIFYSIHPKQQELVELIFEQVSKSKLRMIK